MTTIVYDHKAKQIAVDSRSTNSGMIVSDEDIKWLQDESGCLWFLSGCLADTDLLLHSFKDGDRAFDLPEIPDAIAMIMRNGDAFLRGVTDKGEAWTQKLSCNRSIGSGSSFAIAALDFGCSAKEAVEYAAKRDCYTGGKIHVYDIASAKFIE